MAEERLQASVFRCAHSRQMEPEKQQSNEQSVTPWKVEAGKDATAIDYNRIIEQFGSVGIDDALLARIERVTGKPVHPWLKRELFFSHRYKH